MTTSVFTKKFFGTAGILVAFILTSFIGATTASAFYSLSGKKIQFRGVVQAKTSTSLTLLTSAPKPTKIILNSSTKYPSGAPKVGDVVFVVARIKSDRQILALIVKKSHTGGPGDMYGDDDDDDHDGHHGGKHDRDGHFSKNDRKCPWITVKNGNNRDSFKIDSNTRFIGTSRCEDLRDNDRISVIGRDDERGNAIAKTVIKHTRSSDGDDIPENEDDDN